MRFVVYDDRPFYPADRMMVKMEIASEIARKTDAYYVSELEVNSQQVRMVAVPKVPEAFIRVRLTWDWDFATTVRLHEITVQKTCFRSRLGFNTFTTEDLADTAMVFHKRVMMMHGFRLIAENMPPECIETMRRVCAVPLSMPQDLPANAPIDRMVEVGLISRGRYLSWNHNTMRVIRALDAIARNEEDWMTTAYQQYPLLWGYP